MAPLLGFALFVGVFMSVAAPVAQAATTSSTLNFQARLLNSAGGIVPDGNYNIEFKIYNADSTTGSQGSCSGACLWMETRTGANVIPVINGYFSVNLGSVTAFGSINWDQQLWLTMRIGGTGTPSWDGEMQNSGHSIALTALPYAFTAGQLALTSGAHRGTLGFNTVANDPNILLPDASGTICLQTSSACGFETTTGTDFIQNQTAAVQTAGFNISGTGIIGTALQTPLVQTTDSAAANTAAITLRSGNETGSSLSSGSVTIKSGDAAGGTNSSSGNITIDSGTKSGTGTTGTISIGTTSASGITIGQTGGSAVTAIDGGGGITLGNNTTVAAGKTLSVTSALTSLTGATSGDALNVSNSTSTGNIAVFNDNSTPVLTISDGGGLNINPDTAASTITIGSTSETGGLTFGQSTDTNTINIGNANTATGKTQTINIGAGTPAGTGLTNVTIGNSVNGGALSLNSGSGGISLGGNTTVAASKTLTVTSALTSLTGSTSGDALNVSNSTSTGNIAVFKNNATPVLTIANGGLTTLANNNAAGLVINDSASSKSVLTVDTAGDTVILGNSGASGITGKLKFNFAAQTGSITLDATNPSSTGYTIHLPAENGTLCIQASSSCGFISGTGTAFVNGGNSGFGGTGVLGTIDSNGLNIITNNHVVQSLSTTGAAAFENFSDSNTAFRIQTSTASALLNANTSDGYVINNGVDNLGNEIQNPSFESSGTTDATGWYTPSATQVITNSSANAHSGNYELQVTGNSTTHAVTTPYFAVHPGDTIYAEAWVKNSAGATGDAGIYIEFDDKDKASTTFSNADTGLPGTSYVKKTITATVPAGSYFLRLAASVKATATTGTFYFDDFYLKKANEPAPLLITNTSSTAFQVQNSSSVTVLGVDATTNKLFSNLADGASAVGFTLNTANTYSTAGAKLLSLQNGGAEKFSVDKDGNVNIPATKFYEVGGSQIASTNLSDSSHIVLNNAANTFSSTNSFQVTNTNGFQVQDAAGSHTYIQADTNGGTLYLGNTQTGSTVQIGNSTGVAVTQTINIGSTNTTASSASTITIGSTIGGSLTLQPGGGIIVAAGALGTADNTSYLCRNSSNKLAACITTGTGVAFVNGGNTLGSLTGSLASLGTKDANSLQIITNNTGRATFDQSNNLYLGNADGSGTNAAPNNFNVKGTGSSATGTAGGNLNLYGGAGNGSSTGSAGGNVSINGGAAGGSGDNAGGNITLVAGLNTGVGAAGNVTVKNAANSTSAFQVQTTGSAAVFSVNTSTPTVTVAGGTVFASNTYTSGANSTITQSLVDNNTTISATATATGLTFTVPAPTTATTGRLLYVGNGGTNAFTLNTGAGSYNLAPGSSATLIYIGSAWTIAGIDASTLQLGYTNSIGGTTPEIKLDSTRSTLNIQDADSTVGADILDINASNGGGGGLGTVVFGVGNTGATKVHTTGSGSTTAFVVQDASNNNFIAVDTTSGGNSVTIDSDTGAAGTVKIGNVGGHAQTVNIGLTASNASNSTINIATNANASATNTITIGSNGNTTNAVNIEGGNTGGINLGNTDVTHTFNIGNGASTTTQTVNIGSNSGSSVVNLKSDAGINLKTNSSTNNGVLIQSVTTNSTAALQVQNSSNNSLFNIDTTSDYITLGSTSQALTATQGVKIYAGAGTNSAVDLLATTDSSSNSFYYGANNSRAQFGYDGANGAASVKAASGKGFELQVNANAANSITVNSSGQTTFHTNTDSTAGFVVQNSGNATVLSVDTSGRALRVMENGGSTNYALIYYDTATSTANYTASSGTVAVGTGSGAITVNSGSGAAVNITGHAASSWQTTAGTLTLQSGSGSSDYLILNSGGSGQVQVNGSAVVKFGSASADPTCINGAFYYNTTSNTFRGCLNGTWSSMGSISTPTLQTTYNSSTGSTTPEIKLNAGGTDTGAFDIQDADTSLAGIIFAVRGTNAGGLGTSLLNVNTSTGTVNIGTSDTTGTLLVLDTDSDSTFNQGTISNAATEINGAMFYSSTDHNFMCGVAGAWTTCNGLLYSNTSIGSAINTCTTACGNLGAASIPANYCQAGRVIHIYARGHYGTTSAPTLQMEVRYGTNTTRTSDTLIGAASPTATAGSTISNAQWIIDYKIVCFSTTSMDGQGLFYLQTVTTTTATGQFGVFNMVSTASTTGLTTSSAANLYLFPVWSANSASNTITTDQYVVTGN